MTRTAPMVDLGPAFWPTGMAQRQGPSRRDWPAEAWPDEDWATGQHPQPVQTSPSWELESFERRTLQSPFSLLRSLGEGSRGVITNLSALGLPDSRIHVREAQGRIQILLGSSNPRWKSLLEDRLDTLSAALSGKLGTQVELTIDRDVA